MTKLELEDNLINYKRGHISLETMITVVDRYSSASNDGKPVVKRSSCWNCGLPKKYHQNGKAYNHCECGAVQQDDA